MNQLDQIKKAIAQEGVAKTAARLGVAEGTVYRWIRTGRGPAQLRTIKPVTRLGRRVAK